MIVLDANVMIAALADSDSHFERAFTLLRAAGRGRLVAHRITLAETLVQAARGGRGADALAALAAIGVGQLDEPDDPVRLAELRVRTGLRMPDCVVLDEAHRDRARLATFDQRLAEAARHEGVSVVAV